MKRTISVVLVLVAIFSLCGVMASAESAIPFKDANHGSVNLNGDVYVTKNPESENASEAGAVTFIAKAGNATSIKWYIGDENGETVYALDDAPNHFTGLKVQYSDNNRQVTISNIPEALDEWQVVAEFEGQNGPVYTKAASIHIKNWVFTEQELMAMAVWQYNHTCPYCGGTVCHGVHTTYNGQCPYYYYYG